MSSQYQKALAAILSENTTAFNKKYATTGTGELDPKISYDTFKLLNSGTAPKNSILNRAYRNYQLKYGSRATSPTEVNQTNSRPSSPSQDPTTFGGKSKKRSASTRKYKKRHARKKRSTRKN